MKMPLCVVATIRTHRTEDENTHVDHSSSEASPTQDKVRHVGGAAWDPEGHVSDRRLCRRGGLQVPQLQAAVGKHTCDFSSDLREHGHRGGDDSAAGLF